MRGISAPCPIKALVRPSRAPSEEAPKSGQYGIDESYGKVQGSAEEGCHGIGGTSGVSQEDTIKGRLWKEILGRSLGSHDAAELASGMFHGNGSRQEPTRLQAISCTRQDGALSLLIEHSSRHWHDPFARAKKYSLPRSEREKRTKLQFEPSSNGHNNGEGATLQQPPSTQE